jgi:hypothetical protein
MALFQKFGEKVSRGAQDRVEAVTALFKTPEGTHAQRVNNFVTFYVIVVFGIMITALGYMSGKGYMAFVVLLAGVGATTVTAQKRAIPFFYTLFAPRMGWPSWEEGWRQDQVEKERQQAPAAPAAAMAPVPSSPRPETPVPVPVAPENPSKKVLAAWASLDAERRKARAMDVVKYLLTLPDAPDHMRPVLALPEGSIQADMAASMLAMAAKAEGLALAA